ncbi:ORF6N domain-containing protein [Ruminococcaceae bacterium YRB3002]|nr:ORF6N domain-containing protein [Ruminococcaceae bacterium YRB3002]
MNNTDNRIIVVTESMLKERIHVIRSQRVMLDFDLDEIYGYSTKAFNQQVKNNIDRFPDDFRFQLSREEVNYILRSKNLTSSWGGSRYLPYAFTEQGIYMLMSTLKGDLAVSQSIALVRLFKAMKDYLIENQTLLLQKNYFALVDKVEENSKEIKEMRESMVSKTDLSDFIKLFDQGLSNEEILILDGQPFKADEAYQKIYRSAKSKIMVIDDYIGTKTLHHLAHSKKNAKITIISDNAARPGLRLSEYNDYLTENPGRTITFLQSLHRSHDRYIVLDEGTKDMKVYHCGASSKDAGKRITTITRLSDIDDYKTTVRSMLGNPVLQLR